MGMAAETALRRGGLLCAAPPGHPGPPVRREFIRAVIFTCGGSRWKRLSLMAAEPEPAADSAPTASNKLLGNFNLQSILDPEVEQLQRSSPFLGWETFKDLYSLNYYNEYVPMTGDFKKFVRQIEEAGQKDRGGTGNENPMESSNYLWARYPRRKRESLGLAGMCCKWGCTKVHRYPNKSHNIKMPCRKKWEIYPVCIVHFARKLFPSFGKSQEY
uniref:Uncharacterized protein n=1 Tax=Malurus cyaneus samueli TaxID=2593467 RepID=A0A8C5TK64_9PASS